MNGAGAAAWRKRPFGVPIRCSQGILSNVRVDSWALKSVDCCLPRYPASAFPCWPDAIIGSQRATPGFDRQRIEAGAWSSDGAGDRAVVAGLLSGVVDLEGLTLMGACDLGCLSRSFGCRGGC